MKASRYALLALIPLAAGSLAFAAGSRPAPAPEPSPAARAVGPAESCIPLAQVRETRIRDDWTIDFIANNRRAWRNRLTDRCPGLKVNDGFTYETSLSQLCSTDIVYVLETAGGLRRGAGCGLGPFVPVELEK